MVGLKGPLSTSQIHSASRLAIMPSRLMGMTAVSAIVFLVSINVTKPTAVSFSAAVRVLSVMAVVGVGAVSVT